MPIRHAATFIIIVLMLFFTIQSAISQNQSPWALDQVVSVTGNGNPTIVPTLTPSQNNEEAFLFLETNGGGWMGGPFDPGDTFYADYLTSLSAPWQTQSTSFGPGSIAPAPSNLFFKTNYPVYNYWDSDSTPIGATASAVYDTNYIIGNNWAATLALIKYQGNVPVNGPQVAAIYTGFINGTVSMAVGSGGDSHPDPGFLSFNSNNPGFLIGMVAISSLESGPQSITDPAGDSCPIISDVNSPTGCSGSCEAGSITVPPPYCLEYGIHWQVFICPNYTDPTGFDSSIAGPVQLTSSRVPWTDPPPGGGYMPPAGTDPDNSYPFYYDPNGELASYEDGSSIPACTLPLSSGYTLAFHDAPGDTCLPGGRDVNTATCGNTAEPNGSYGGYETYLAGVNSNGTPIPLGVGFKWISTFNGTTGGVSIKKTNLPADGNGTGGITITHTNGTTNYQGLGLTSAILLSGSQISTTASGPVYNRGSKLFYETLTITNDSENTITGAFQIVLDSLQSNITLVNASGIFGGWPYITVPNVSNLEPGQSASVIVEFSNPTYELINVNPMVYSGSFE
jgi:hypothetical protein